MGDKLGNKVGFKRFAEAWLIILELGSFKSLGVDEKKMKLEVNQWLYECHLADKRMNEGWREFLEFCR
jgi:hypothetical protein